MKKTILLFLLCLKVCWSYSQRITEQEALDRALCEKARQLAARDGLTVSFSESDRFPATVNDDACIDRVSQAALAVTGAPPLEMMELWRASEDFGHYLKHCEGAMFYVGNGEAYPPVHTEAYDFNDRILEPAVEMMKALAVMLKVRRSQ